MKRCKFKESDIVGITELCREIMNLDMPTKQAVHRKLAVEQRRIRIELEPQINGKFVTSVLDMIEPHPSVTRSDATLLVAHPCAAPIWAAFAYRCRQVQGSDNFAKPGKRIAR